MFHFVFLACARIVGIAMQDDFRRAENAFGVGSATCSRKHTKIMGGDRRREYKDRRVARGAKMSERESVTGHLKTGELNHTRDIISVGRSVPSPFLSIGVDNQTR